MSTKDVVIDLDSMDEDQLLSHLSHLRSTIFEVETDEEETKIEESMNVVRKRIKFLRTARFALEDIAQREDEEKQAKIREAEEEREKEEKKKQKKEDRMEELDSKYLEAARMRYTAVYKTKEYDQLIEDSNFNGPLTPEILLQLAQMIRKVENQKITLKRLIEKRERLDQEILKKMVVKALQTEISLLKVIALRSSHNFYMMKSLTLTLTHFMN